MTLRQMTWPLPTGSSLSAYLLLLPPRWRGVLPSPPCCATCPTHLRTYPSHPNATLLLLLQGIVISLKDTFFEKADALVGVCKDNELGCSATYTFDLNRFGEASP